jgi:hypothetical protein
MAGLDPAIRAASPALSAARADNRRASMMDGRVKPGHDG